MARARRRGASGFGRPGAQLFARNLRWRWRVDFRWGILEPEVRQLALAGDGDILTASRMSAIAALFGNRSRDFVGIDSTVGYCLRKIP